MRVLPTEFKNCKKLMRQIAARDRLEFEEVISETWSYLSEGKHIDADTTMSAVSSRLRRLNHFEHRTISDTLLTHDTVDERNVDPLDLLIKREMKQQVKDFISANFGGSEDAALAHFGDTKALADYLCVTRRRAQQIIKKWKKSGHLSAVEDVRGDE